MRCLNRLATVALAFAITLPGLTNAGTLWTASLRPGSGHFLVCRITNVSDDPRVVSIEIYGRNVLNEEGALLQSVGPVTVAPLNTQELAAIDIDAPRISPHNCKFTIAGGKGSYRMTGCTSETTLGPDIACVAAE